MKKINLPKVSIVIPCYNEERDLQLLSLSSIRSQDYPQDNIEILLVDDGSTDKTVEIGKSFNCKILKNGTKNIEIGKNIGFKVATGSLFMYLDADMKLASKDWLRMMVKPFMDDKRIAGNFAYFAADPTQPSLTRCISYDEFQRDPIFRILTVGAKEIIKEKKDGWYLCECDKNSIPPQGCMLYRKELLNEYSSTHELLDANEVPAHLVYSGHKYYAVVPDAKIYHWQLRSLRELWHKRVRNMQVYKEVIDDRKFTWFELKKDWMKAGLWMFYTNSIIFPICVSIFKTIKHRDVALLAEPVLNLVSTYSIIYSVLTSGKVLKILK